MSTENSDIKIVYLQICRAEELYKSRESKIKKSNKWRVSIITNERKWMTELVPCAEGHPYWNHKLEIKLLKGHLDPITLLVTDTIFNQYGQISIPLNEIPYRPEVNESTQSNNFKCSKLEPSKKCRNPSGILFYRIWVKELYSDENNKPQPYFPKRNSIFSFISDQIPKRKQSYAVSASQSELSHSGDQKTLKRLSVFRFHDKPNKFNQRRSKTKSLADIHQIDDISQNFYRDSDNFDQQYLPSNDVYEHVTKEYNWVRVKDLQTDYYLSDSCPISQEGKNEVVEIFSVQPSQGPIAGNFTVTLEGYNFTKGLSDLTYVIIGGSERMDAKKFIKILSDKEISLTMPPVPTPEVVNIHLELFDGFKISCSQEFHYVDTNIDCNDAEGSSLKPVEDQDRYSIMIDHFFDHYEVITTPTEDYKPIESEVNIINSNDHEGVNANAYQRKFSDYGSQGSLHSEGTSTLLKKIKHLNVSKSILTQEVEILRKDISDLKSKYDEMYSESSCEIENLKYQLECRDREIDKLSVILCNLKSKLLEDGMTKYLERLN